MSFKQERQFNKVSLTLVILNVAIALLQSNEHYYFDYSLKQNLSAKYLPD